MPWSAVCLPWLTLQLWSQRKASVTSGECCFACNTSCHGSSSSQFFQGSHQLSNPQHNLFVKFPDKSASGQVGPQPDLNFEDSFKPVGVASAVLPVRMCHPSVLSRSAVCLPWQALQLWRLWSKRKASVASGECCFACGTRTKLAMQQHSCHGSSFNHFVVVSSSGAQEHLQIHYVF